MEYIILVLLAVILVLQIILVSRKPPENESDAMLRYVDSMSRTLVDNQNAARTSQKEQLDNIYRVVQQTDLKMGQFTQANRQDTEIIRQVMEQHLISLRQDNEKRLEEIRALVDVKLANIIQERMTKTEVSISTFTRDSRKDVEAIREVVDKHLLELRTDNAKKLDEMRAVVDEKLQKSLNERLNQSFAMVSDRLEQVYKGLGEMQALAQGVGDLKKVLGNVKTRGIVGEIQLGAILEDFLTPEQYETNVVTVPGTRNPVEFAVKIPVEAGFIRLPIDSKFPGETYGALRDAYDNGTREEIDICAARLIATLKTEAKDIRDKYIQPPHTTDFGIMFLPFEGLYAEAVSRGMVEVLAREYHVNIAGPSTMAALLNSIQQAFRTIAIQKRSGEVWNVLGAVKTEFDKFESTLTQCQSRIEQAGKELDKLVGVRTRAIKRKLRDVEELSPEQVPEFLPAHDEE